MKLPTIKKRKTFLLARNEGRKFIIKSMIIQYIKQDITGFQVGFTVTKKIGNAVTRNRVKRRLREAVWAELPYFAKDGFSYIFIARSANKSKKDIQPERNFSDLKEDVRYAMSHIHRGKNV